MAGRHPVAASAVKEKGEGKTLDHRTDSGITGIADVVSGRAFLLSSRSEGTNCGPQTKPRAAFLPPVSYREEFYVFKWLRENFKNVSRDM